MKKYVVWLALVCLYASPVGFVALTGCGSGAAEKLEGGEWSKEEEMKKGMEMDKEMMEVMKQQQADMKKAGGNPAEAGGMPPAGN